VVAAVIIEALQALHLAFPTVDARQQEELRAVRERLRQQSG
jgi:hypothetical protein